MDMIAIDNIKNQLPAPTPASVTAAAAGYARHARRCGVLLGWLNDALRDHAPVAAAHPGSWGYVLDLAVLEQQLALALRLVAHKEESQIEQMLADLEVQA